MDLFYETS
jgi:hypothetical protein